MATFAVVHRELDSLASGEVKRVVAVEHDLDEVVARFHLGERAGGISKGLGIDNGGLAGDPIFNVEAKHLLGGRALVDLVTGFGLSVGR